MKRTYVVTLILSDADTRDMSKLEGIVLDAMGQFDRNRLRTMAAVSFSYPAVDSEKERSE